MLKKGFILVAILGLVGTASAAEINLFWSTTGINNPDLMYYTGMTNFDPWFVPPTPTTGGPAGAYDLFLWGQFPSNWTDYQIYGLEMRFEGDASHSPNLAYRQRGRWGSGGLLPLDSVLAAVTGNGIYDTPGNLVQPDGAFLLGIVHAVGTDGQVLIMALDAADGLGINCRDANGNDVVPDPTVTPAIFYFGVPEPACFALMLSIAVTRRR